MRSKDRHGTVGEVRQGTTTKETVNAFLLLFMTGVMTSREAQKGKVRGYARNHFAKIRYEVP